MKCEELQKRRIHNGKSLIFFSRDERLVGNTLQHFRRVKIPRGGWTSKSMDQKRKQQDVPRKPIIKSWDNSTPLVNVLISKALRPPTHAREESMNCDRLT